MPSRSDNTRYGSVALAIHWLSAILIIVALALGLRAADMTDPVARIAALRIHVAIGLLVLALTLFRIVWWWRFDSKPAPASGTVLWQQKLGGVVHLLLYIIIVGTLASGVAMMALSGAMPILFQDGPGPLPDFFTYAPRIPHEIAGKVLMVLLVVHIVAALYHHFIRRDATLRRMWFARRAK